MRRTLWKLLVILSVLFVSVGSTVAYLTDVEQEVNVMTLGRVEIDLIEQERNSAGTLVNFQDNHPLYPGVHKNGLIVGTDGYWVDVRNAIDKIVTVKNTGKAPAYVRLWFAFEVTDDNKFFDGKIHLNRNTADWQWDFMKDDSGYQYLTLNGSRYVVATATYNKVLTSNTTTPVSLRQVLLDSSATNDDFVKLGDKYSIFVVAQAMQTEGFDSAVEALAEGFGEPSVKNHPFAGMMEEDAPITDAVAMVNGAYHYDFASAFAAWQDGTTLTLLANYSEEQTIEVKNQDVTLDLNGHGISTTMGSAIQVNAGAELTVIDSRGGGSIYGENYLDGAIGIVNFGAVTIYGGTITSREEVSVSNIDSATATIYDGTYMQLFNSASSSMYIHNGSITGGIGNDGYMVVYGGHISNSRHLTGNTENPAINNCGNLIISGTPVFSGSVDIENFSCENDNGQRSKSAIDLRSATIPVEGWSIYANDDMTIGSVTESNYLLLPDNCHVLQNGSPVDSIKAELIATVVPILSTSDFEWEKNADGTSITITGYTGTDTDVVIPSTIGNLPVTAISNNAFCNKTTLTSIIVPQSVQTIGSGAFCYCEALETITLPDNLEVINSNTFLACFSLKQVNIPTNCQSIGDLAFMACESLSTIVFPEGVTYIGKQAFGSCYNLQEIVFPNSLRTIDINAFVGCKVSHIVLPEGVTSIGDAAFCECENLEIIYAPKSLTSIGDSAFATFNRKTIVMVVDGSYAHTYCIENDVAFELIDSDESASPVEDFMWEETEDGRGIVITEYMGTETTVSVPATIEGLPVVYIGAESFNGCRNITKVIIPESVNSIEQAAFVGCTNLEIVDLPDALYGIGYSAFEMCTKLNNIVFPDSLSYIESQAFTNCSNLTSIVIPSTIRHIYFGTFSECSSLTTAIISQGTKSIGEYAFSGCTSLSTVTIPDSVTSIEDYAFFRCTNLRSITIPGSVTSMGIDVFSGCSNLTLQVPAGSYAEKWCIKYDMPYETI